MRKSFKVCHLLGLSAVFCIALFFSTWCVAADSVMVIKYATGHAPDTRHGYDYAYELMRLILEETKAEYGDYRIEAYVTELDAKRQAVLLTQGDLINLSGNSSGTVVAGSESIRIPFDIYRGLLGRRVCLTNGGSATRFDSVTDLNSLKNIRVGQSKGWADIEIYNFNKLPLVQASTFEGLLGMLIAGRFECLALGINEIGSIYESNRGKMPKLQIEKSLLLYYEYPFYFYISAKYPKLAERFKVGMEKIQANGEFDQLFIFYFRKNLDALNIKSRRVICLQSPFIDKKTQCQNMESINSLDEKALFREH